MVEFAYNYSLNPDKATKPKKLGTIVTNMPLFPFQLGLVYQMGIINAQQEKIPIMTRMDREKEYPYNQYQDNPKGIEQLHWAFEWGYRHGKEGWSNMTKERMEEIDCPKCSGKQTETVWETINVTLNPELRKNSFRRDK